MPVAIADDAHGGRRRRVIGDIELHEPGAQLGRRLLTALDAARADIDGLPGLDQLPCRFVAEPLVGSGDQCDGHIPAAPCSEITGTFPALRSLFALAADLPAGSLPPVSLCAGAVAVDLRPAGQGPRHQRLLARPSGPAGCAQCRHGYRQAGALPAPTAHQSHHPACLVSESLIHAPPRSVPPP